MLLLIRVLDSCKFSKPGGAAVSFVAPSLSRTLSRSLAHLIRAKTDTDTHTYTYRTELRYPRFEEDSTSILDLGILDLPPVQLAPVIAVFTGPDRVSISKIQRRLHINLES